jgi:hypothetical protein
MEIPWDGHGGVCLDKLDKLGICKSVVPRLWWNAATQRHKLTIWEWFIQPVIWDCMGLFIIGFATLWDIVSIFHSRIENQVTCNSWTPLCGK